MTFYELLCKHPVEELWYILSKHHDLVGKPIKAERIFASYKSAHSELIKLYSIDNSSENVLICELTIDNDDAGAPDSWVHCNMLSPNEDGSGEITKYAMDFVAWEELVGCKVSEDSLAKLGELVCVAELLWEITFYGYSSARVDGESQKLQEIISDIDNGKSETVSWNPEEYECMLDRDEDVAIAQWLTDAPDKVKQFVYGFFAADMCGRDEDIDDITVAEVLKRLKAVIDNSKVEDIGDLDFASLLRSMLDSLDIDEQHLLLSKIHSD